MKILFRRIAEKHCLRRYCSEDIVQKILFRRLGSEEVLLTTVLKKKLWTHRTPRTPRRSSKAVLIDDNDLEGTTSSEALVLNRDDLIDGDDPGRSSWRRREFDPSRDEDQRASCRCSSIERSCNR